MDAITIAAIGMQDSINRLNSTSQNLANVSTPGYKKEIPVSRSFAALLGEVTVDIGTVADAASISIPEKVIDYTPGTMRYTGNPLDVAIDGDGFFEVETESGPAYTRQGALHIDMDGRLVTAEGLPVVGSGGPIVISGTSATIARNGEVYQGEQLAGKLRMVRFSNKEGLMELGGGLYAQGSATMLNDPVDVGFRSGFQENSNVNSAQEMVRLSETMRHFESMQRVIQGYDEIMGNAIQKLGEF